MCGIAGIVPGLHRDLPAGLLRRFQEALRHRGPDDLGYLVLRGGEVELGHEGPPDGTSIGEAALVHRRLSILDLTETGWQPMGSPDGRHYVVFNGEIYNFIEVRRELESAGDRFTTRSDTEVLLAAYRRWGTACLKRLVGMFAFALLDRQARRLLLARDFFGIKPLYYVTGGGLFAFASEIKALLGLPHVTRRANPEGVYQYLRYGLTDHGPETLFADVRQLPPAHFLEVSLDAPSAGTPVRYWDVEAAPRFGGSFEDAAEQLRALFLDSVRLHMRSDVPVGAALSGGIDSSGIVMGMREVAGPAAELHTFTYVADAPSLNEEKWATAVGRAAGATMHCVCPSPDELVRDLSDVILCQDEPFTTTSIYAQYRVFRLAQEAGIKVMLDGQGADESFGGYAFHLAARLASMLSRRRFGAAGGFLAGSARLPGTSPLRLLLESAAFLVPPGLHTLPRKLIGRAEAPPWLDAGWFRSRGAATRSINYDRVSGEVFGGHLRRSLTTTSLPSLLRYEDRNSMAFSIESRVPFLEVPLVAFVLSLPEEYLAGPDATSKRVLRAALRGLVPDCVLDRRDKMAFAAPPQWLRSMGGWIERVLGAAPDQGPLRKSAIRSGWERTRRSGGDIEPWLWRSCCLLEWARLFSVEFD